MIEIVGILAAVIVTLALLVFYAIVIVGVLIVAVAIAMPGLASDLIDEYTEDKKKDPPTKETP